MILEGAADDADTGRRKGGGNGIACIALIVVAVETK
jgi:hypothetical protein